VEGISYLSTAFSLAPGEGLLLYSDGVTEAKDATEAFFGRERLLEN
jgi:serine phosphatase RsbU (regulator of sigma subunit)